jgi:HSP20 family protein
VRRAPTRAARPARLARRFVRAEVPGIDPKDIEVNLSGEVLTITGRKLDEEVEERSRYHHSERRFGSFQRGIRLPMPVEPDAVAADYKNGVLTVTLRKAEALRPKKIAIKRS